MKGWIAAALFCGLAGCLENPGVDRRLGRDAGNGQIPWPPPPPLTQWPNTMARVEFGFGALGIYMVPAQEKGVWMLMAESYSDSSSPEAGILVQVAPPTTPGCCGTGSPPFYPESVPYESTLIVPSMPPGKRIQLTRFLLPQLATPDQTYLNAVGIREGGGSDTTRFPAWGLYDGEYRLVRDHVSFRAGSFKAVVDAAGRMGVSAGAERPDASWIRLAGTITPGNPGNLGLILATYLQDNLLSNDLPIIANRFEGDGFELRFLLLSGDSVVLEGRRRAYE